MEEKKRILVSPLDWGLGHATRCIPIIKQLLKRDVEVIIGADNGALALLREEFPQLQFVEMPGYEIKYPKNGGNMVVKMLFSAPKVLKKIKKEHLQLMRIIKRFKIDAVISDNRFGLYTRKIPTVFITHQIHIPTPLMKERVYRLNRNFIQKFTECWVPDYEEAPTLSGTLSHNKRKLPTNIKYVGPLSRFNAPLRKIESYDYDILAVISGPEPMRTDLEELLISQISMTGKKALLVKGLPKEKSEMQIGNLKIVSHLPAHELKSLLERSRHIVTRAGYSTIMDLAALQKSAVLIPTPGQPEQQYLAKLHKQKKHFFYMMQKDFDITTALNEIDNYTESFPQYNEDVLEENIDRFLGKL